MGVATAFRLPAPPPAAEADHSLDQALALGWSLLGGVEAFARQLDLGDLDLPPVVGTEADQAQLVSLPPLYLAAELESTRLVPAVEAFAGAFVSGAIPADLGPTGAKVMAFWQARRDRFSAEEREALFGRLFGKVYGPILAVESGRNQGFDGLMIDLCEALTAFQGTVAAPVDLVRLRTSASELAANLAPRGGGIASFAAADLLKTVQAALDLLKQAAVQQAVGGHGVWNVVRALSRRYLGRETDVSSHVSRGKAGLLVLTWLAESLPRLAGPGPVPMDTNDPAVAAAVSWLEASLTLAQRRNAVSGQRTWTE